VRFCCAASRSGDESQGAAEFGTKQFGVCAQNDMKISDKFKLSYGLEMMFQFGKAEWLMLI
jgi:hypothetical protein